MFYSVTKCHMAIMFQLKQLVCMKLHVAQNHQTGCLECKMHGKELRDMIIKACLWMKDRNPILVAIHRTELIRQVKAHLDLNKL